MVRMRVTHRTPGEHGVIGAWDVPAVPRENEALEIDGRSFTVHDVSWTLIKGVLTAYVLVR